MIKPMKKGSKTKKNSNKKGNKKNSMSDFMYSTDVDTMLDEADDSFELTKYETFIADVGDNVGMILPGTKATDGKILVRRMIHGLNDPCARSSRTDRFEQCPSCSYWFEHRTTRAERDSGTPPNFIDSYRPKDVGVFQWINLTWACEHKKVRSGDKITEKLVSSDIDMARVKKCMCFLDEKTFDSESDKCKNCIAFKSCFQGPQFVVLSKPRVQELLDEQARIGGKKKVLINGKKIPLRGNISLAWWILHGKKEIAKRVSYPLIYKKIVDPNIKERQFATSYKISFSRNEFVIPKIWQERILARARDLSEFLKPVSEKIAKKFLLDFIKNNKKTDRPACFDDEDSKDTSICDGEDCPYYDKCCVDDLDDEKKGRKRSRKKGDKKSSKRKGNKTKQEKAVEELSVDDDDDDVDIDALMAEMNNIDEDISF